jgi:hypothetical protein
MQIYNSWLMQFFTIMANCLYMHPYYTEPAATGIIVHFGAFYPQGNHFPQVIKRTPYLLNFELNLNSKPQSADVRGQYSLHSLCLILKVNVCTPNLKTPGARKK